MDSIQSMSAAAAMTSRPSAIIWPGLVCHCPVLLKATSPHKNHSLEILTFNENLSISI